MWKLIATVTIFYYIIGISVGDEPQFFQCNITSNNKPSCAASTSVGKICKDSYDPLQYWKCQAINTPVSVKCEHGTGYDVLTKACVEWNRFISLPLCDSCDS